jgi:hypothetical protein
MKLKDPRLHCGDNLILDILTELSNQTPFISYRTAGYMHTRIKKNQIKEYCSNHQHKCYIFVEYLHIL